MGSRTVHFDDLDGVESEEIVKHKFTIDGVEVEDLELRPVTFEAVETFLAKRDPSLLRQVFAPATANGGRRSHDEIERIRAAARAALNPDGTPMFTDIKNTGRIRNDVEQWYDNVYTPAQENTEDADAEVPAETGTEAAETPTKPRGRRS